MLVSLDNWKCRLRHHGRILDLGDEGLALNWTNAAVSFCFEGSILLLKARPIPGEEQEPDGSKRETFPVIGVFLEEEVFPVRTITVQSEGPWLLYYSSKVENHKITLRKLSENAVGKLVITGFLGDGSLKPVTESTASLSIEFVGDSITCGYGNMVNERNRGLYSEEENGWLSYAAVASRELNAEMFIVARSGISATRGLDPKKFPFPVMEDLYPYTDYLMEEQKNERQLWNFDAHPQNVIVVNLGTNDSSIVALGEDIFNGELQFREDYLRLLHIIRQKNGAKPWIVCALGPLDYYLYDTLQGIVAQFKKEQKDQRICAFKFGRVRMEEGVGAANHPTWKTHKRMGKELAAFLKTLPIN